MTNIIHPFVYIVFDERRNTRANLDRRFCHFNFFWIYVPTPRFVVIVLTRAATKRPVWDRGVAFAVAQIQHLLNRRLVRYPNFELFTFNVESRKNAAGELTFIV